MRFKLAVMRTRHRLREIRLQAGLTEAKLAKKLKKSRTTIYKIEGGEINPSHETLLSWVSACGHFVAIFPKKMELLLKLSSLNASELAVALELLEILPQLSKEHREMYAQIFAGLPGDRP